METESNGGRFSHPLRDLSKKLKTYLPSHRPRKEIQQTQSKLCCLPMEIKIMIWTYLLGCSNSGAVLHVYQKYGHMGHFICLLPCPDNQPCSWRHPCSDALGRVTRHCDDQGFTKMESLDWYQQRSFTTAGVKRDEVTLGLGKVGLAGILGACQEVYKQLSHFVYTKINFHFPHDMNLINLPAKTLNLITTLTIDWTAELPNESLKRYEQPYPEIWATIATMQSLREARVMMKILNLKGSAPGEALVYLMKTVANKEGLEKLEIVVDHGEWSFWDWSLSRGDGLGRIEVVPVKETRDWVPPRLFEGKAEGLGADWVW